MSMGQQQPAPGWAPPPPQQPKKSNVGKIVGFSCLGVAVLGIVIVVVLGLAVGKAVKTAATSTAAPVAGHSMPSATASAAPGAVADIQITSCTVDEFGLAHAALTITNHSSKKSNYTVQVDFIDSSGARTGQGFAATNDLDPAAVAKTEAGDLAQVKDAKITCKVSQVNRYASF
jgi:uncharacterized protein (UPF0333 family)